MLIALFADIHANRQAFAACLAQAREYGAERFVLLGDYVGYGADPAWTVDAVMDLVGRGATAILGNHDNAVANPRERLNAAALTVMEWTRGELGPAQRRFLAELPLTVDDDDRRFVHAESSKPESWRYVTNAADAERGMLAASAHITFCGHIHQPALYSLSSTGKMTSFTPTTDVAVQLLPGRRWLAVLGSVGQPRDGNSAAAFAMLNTAKHELTYCRVPYDIEQAAGRIRKQGLPPWLAERLYTGT